MAMTPDKEAMFVNIQHLGDSAQVNNFTSNRPLGMSKARLRSATVIVTRDDGGGIGTV